MASDDTSEHIPASRSTAPQSPFTGRQVVIGALVLVVGLIVVGALPILGSL